MTAHTKPIGLFYGSSTCYTEMAGEKIRDTIGSELVDIFNIADEPLSTTLSYPYLILGIPTWDYGELQEDWEEIWGEFEPDYFKGKKVALYGLGDQVGYPEWFLDAMGYLHAKVVALGAIPVGYWSVEGYEFEASKALTPDQSQFVGLALDDENEFDQSQERIEIWCKQIRQEFGL
ncbi:flavodoxin FldB [Marinibactrum halimedae]|uniref:Flavodoxin n=1 Tax=Marinibactrum halimedae TaxID=1444977 RepID=A0AA37WN19_9GAMM|nr:flavodoxin FldB [Marinibactrum halimedae]MCD9458008.1 flavodoxin FldB [Marinibactrum halimedae]GLS27634.1 flavodoxin [Marinibactrum halimedae]